MNTYFGLRHGESEANTLGIIVSLPINGLRRYGLTVAGAAQVAASCDQTDLGLPIIIVSSDFKRTIETAQIAAHHYKTSYSTSPLLRERNFAAFELQSNDNYAKVWSNDAHSTVSPGTETTNSVAKRCSKLIDELENKYSNSSVLIVSHGDTLQIMQCVLQGMPPAKHRSIRHFNPGELRRLQAKE